MMIHFRRDLKGTFRFIFSILFILAIPIILSSLLSCRVTVEGDPSYQGPRPGPGPRPAHLSGIEGQWFINVNNHPGRLEFYWSRNLWTGRIWLDESQQWEDLIDIIFDPGPGHLEFTRPNGSQRYYGIVSGNQISGTLTSPYGTFPWNARRR